MLEKPCGIHEWAHPRRVRSRPMAEPQPPPPVTGISELVLEVADLERSRAFYRDLLGFEETMYGEGREGRAWYLVGETARLGLWTEQIGLAGGRCPRGWIAPR